MGRKEGDSKREGREDSPPAITREKLEEKTWAWVMAARLIFQRVRISRAKWMCKNRVTTLSWAATGQLSRLFTAQRHLVKGQSKGLTCSTAKLGSASQGWRHPENGALSLIHKKLQSLVKTYDQQAVSTLMEVLWDCMKATHGLEGDCVLPTVILHHHRTTSKIQPPSLTAIYSESPEKSQTVQPVFLMDVLTTLCGPMDSSPPGPSVHGILQVRILEWVAISFCRGSSQPRDWIWVARIASRLFTDWTTREDQCYYSRMLDKMKQNAREDEGCS